MIKLREIICTTAILLTTSGVYAQKTADESFRRTAPAPLAEKPFVLPTATETVLPNGLKVILYPDNRLPIVSYGLGFRSGAAYESADSRGLTQAVAGLLKEGTAKRNSKQIADEIERLGASLNAGATADSTIIAASSMAANSSTVLNLMADVVLNPLFPENELAIYKSNTLKGLQFQRAQPSFLAEEQVARVIYGKNGYGVISPTAADVEKINRARLVDFHKALFVPNNAVLIIVGDINPAQTLSEIKQLFGGWQRGTVSEAKFEAPATRTKRTVTIVDRPGSTQSNIILATPALEQANPDYYAVRVMNKILGGGASSRLFMNLREKKSFTYGAYSEVQSQRLAGNFSANSEVRTPVTGDALKEFFYEFERIRTEPVSADELRDAKSFLAGVFPLTLETQEGLLNSIITQHLYDLPSSYLQDYRRKINAVTAEDVQRVAQKYVSADKSAVIIVGDGGEIIKQVKPYATDIEVFDTDGKALDIASFNQPSAAPTVNVTGKWDLTLEVQGQNLPVTLELKQEGEKVSGTMTSMLGNGTIEGGKVSGNKMNATAKTDIQGQAVELKIVGDVTGEDIKGVINASLPGFPPISFSGKRGK